MKRKIVCIMGLVMAVNALQFAREKGIDSKAVWAQEINGAEQNDPYDVYKPVTEATATDIVIDGIPYSTPILSDMILYEDKFTYTGKEWKPYMKVYDDRNRQVSDSDMEITYQNNINVGRATVTVTGRKSYHMTSERNLGYSGTLTHTFDILPQGTKISKLKPETKSVKIKWKKQTTQTDGYEIKYAQNMNFTKAKTITINNNKTSSITIKKLKPEKKYYFRIRTYKDVMVDGISRRFYSEEWSYVKSVRTKAKK